MQKIRTWFRDNGLAVTALTGIGVLFVTAGNVLFLNPIHQRLDDLRIHIDQRFDDQNKAINQRFDAQDQRFDSFEAEMNRLFDAQDKAINQRFDDQDPCFDGLEAGMNQRFDDQDQRIEDVGAEVAALRELTVSIGERVSRNEGQIDVLVQQSQTADAPAPPE